VRLLPAVEISVTVVPGSDVAVPTALTPTSSVASTTMSEVVPPHGVGWP
jgi:hypothetical protein